MRVGDGEARVSSLAEVHRITRRSVEVMPWGAGWGVIGGRLQRDVGGWRLMATTVYGADAIGEGFQS
jgi:hypothetical protein